MKRLRSSGFTIIELMIATVVFSVILLGAVTALIQVGRMYYKGIIASRTQQTARDLLDTISRPIQFNGQGLAMSPSDPAAALPEVSGIRTKVICIGTQRFTFGLNAQVTDKAGLDGQYNLDGKHQARHAVWQDTISNPSACVPVNLTMATPQPNGSDTDTTLRGTGGRELLSQHMRVKSITVSNAVNGVRTVSIGIIYGDDDLIFFSDGAQNQPERCLGNAATGAAWCALSELTTQVIPRVQ